ncbi:hypothetical protein ACHAPT_010342 [Fusarium lateritium]
MATVSEDADERTSPDEAPPERPAKPQAPPEKPPIRLPDGPAPKPAEKPAPDQHKSKSNEFLHHLPQALATYAGVKSLNEHADTAKEWADWFMNIQKAPDEIRALSNKVTAAKGTILQIQNTIAARPDLVEGDSADALRQQMESAIKNAKVALDKMTKLLQDLSDDGLEGTVWEGFHEFYSSYRYKNEWEDKIKAADADLEKQLGTLNSLMVNIYSRALMKPAPPGMSNPAPPPGSSKPSAEPRRSSHEHSSSRSRAGSTGLDPPPMGQFYRPPSPTPVVPENPAEAAPPEPTSAAEPASSEKTPPTEGHSEEKSPESEANSKQAWSTPPAGAPTKDTVKADTDSTQAPQSPPKAAAQQSSEPSKDEPKNEEPAREEPSPPQPNATKAKAPEQPEPADDPEDVLLDAAWNGDIGACGEALRHASPLTRDLQGLTPLHLAAERDHLAIAMLLLDHGADCKARANGGRTPLHLAARFGSAAMVEFLVDDGRADPNARTTDGRTPLHYAASAAEDGDDERREVVRILRDWRADPTIEDNRGRTPRDVAQKRDYWDVSSTLRRAEKRWEEEHNPNWLQRHGFMK